MEAVTLHMQIMCLPLSQGPCTYLSRDVGPFIQVLLCHFLAVLFWNCLRSLHNADGVLVLGLLKKETDN